MSTENIDIVTTETGAAQAATNIRAVGGAAKEAATGVGNLDSTFQLLRTTMSTLGIALGVQQIISMMDAYTNLQNALRQSTSSTEELTAVQDALFDMSQKTRTSFTQNVQAYDQFATALQNTGHSAQDIITTIGNLDSFFTASGSSAQTAQAAITALAIGMQQGTAAGRPLLEIIRSAPSLAQALANELSNGSVPALKAMAENGELTAQKMLEATTSMGFTAAAAKALAGSQITISQAFTTVTNALINYVGHLDETNGANNVLANGLLLVAEYLPQIAAVIETVTAAWAAQKVVALATFAAETAGAFTATIAAEGLGVAITSSMGIIIPLIAAGAAAWLLFGNNSAKAGTEGQSAASKVGSALLNAFKPAQAYVDQFSAKTASATNGLGALGSAGQAAGEKVHGSFSISTADLTTFSGQVSDITSKLQALGDISSPEIAEFWQQQAASAKVVDAYIKQSAQDSAMWADGFHKDAGEVTDDLGRVATNTSNLGLTTRNAFGQMVTAADEWALRSGAAFNQVAQAAGQSAQQQIQDLTAVQQKQSSTANQQMTGGIGFNSGTLTSHQVDTGAFSHFATGGSFLVGGSGGTDSQLVQFMASPNEQVSVSTPGQASGNNGGGGSPITINMQVAAKDANSFNLSRKTVVMGLQSELQRAQRAIGSN